MRGPGVLARPGAHLVVLTSVGAGWVAAGLTDLLWLLPAVPAAVWKAMRTEVPRRSARRPVEPLAAPDRDWQTFQQRSEALRAVEAGPAVLEVYSQQLIAQEAALEVDRTLRYAELTAEETALVVRIERAGYTLADGLELVERRRAALGTL